MLNNPLGTYAENGNLIDRRNTNFDVALHYPSVNWSAAAASATTDGERRFEVICDGRSRMLYASSIGAYVDGFGFFRSSACLGGSPVISNLRSRAKPVPRATVFSAPSTDFTSAHTANSWVAFFCS